MFSSNQSGKTFELNAGSIFEERGPVANLKMPQALPEFTLSLRNLRQAIIDPHAYFCFRISYLPFPKRKCGVRAAALTG